MRRRPKKSPETMRSHLILLTAVATLTCLVVLLGRTPGPPRPRSLMSERSHLELRRGVSLSIGDRTGLTPSPFGTITPIPLPGAERAPAAEEHNFVPLTPFGVEVPGERPTLENTAPQPAVPAGDPAMPIDAPEAELRWHRIVEGETLQSIAQRYFGQEQQASEIYALNQDILTQPDVLPLGVYLRLPPARP